VKRVGVAVLLVAAVLTVTGLVPPGRSAGGPKRGDSPARLLSTSTNNDCLSFGMGDELAGAVSSPAYLSAPSAFKTLTSWYNGPGDMSWMSGYSQGDMSHWYEQGKSLELVVWLANNPSYAISSQFQSDIRTLTSIFQGLNPASDPLYIVLYTELDTYGSGPYLASLEQSYLQAVDGIHSVDPYAQVGLGFGGYDWPPSAGSDPNLSAWAPAIQASDFTTFEDEQSEASVDPNGQNDVVDALEDAVAQLSQYGKPIMVSNFQIWGDDDSEAAAEFSDAVDKLFTGSELQTLTSEGLFAVNFMDNQYINDSPASTSNVLSQDTCPSATYEVGAEGADGGLYVRNNWTSWTSLGGSIIGPPAIAALPQGSGPATPLFIATGTDHRLWEFSGDGPWTLMGPGYCMDAPAAAVQGDTLIVACEGGDSNLYTASMTIPSSGLPSFPRWTSLGGDRSLNAGPAIAVVNGVPTYFVTTTHDGQVWAYRADGGWDQTSYYCVGRPAAGNGQEGQTAWFGCEGMDGQEWAGPVGSGVQALGGSIWPGTGVAVTADGGFVFAQGNDDSADVWMRAPGTAWSEQGGPVTDGVSAVGLY
jgi:hypothetical protein